MLNTVPFATQTRSTENLPTASCLYLQPEDLSKAKVCCSKKRNSNCLDNKLFLCDCVKRTNGDHCKTRKVARSSLKLERKLD